MTDTAPLDPATVQRCIDALTGTGKYGYAFERISDFEPPVRVEQWTYTMHPMDVLRGLLEKDERRTEAEKLVDEWLGGNMDEDAQDYVRLAQFILDKQADARAAEMLAAPVDTRFFDHTNSDGDLLRTTVTTGAMKCDESFGDILHSAMETPEPQYVFGPWMPAVDGRTPPFPAGWYYQMRNARTGEVNPIVQPVQGRFESIDTEYRVRFEVGKW